MTVAFFLFFAIRPTLTTIAALTKEIKDKKSYYDLLVEAGRGAIEDAGLEYSDIDGIWIGACSPSLFINQEHVGPLGLEVAPEEFRFLPTTRTEGACASSSVAIYNAIYGIEAGRFQKALVIGVEKMCLRSTKEVTHALACSSHWPSEGAEGMTFPGLFAEYAKGYKEYYNGYFFGCDSFFGRHWAKVKKTSQSWNKTDKKRINVMN